MINSTDFTKFLASNPSADGRQLAKVIVDTFIVKYKKTRSTSTRSAIDLSKLDAIVMNTQVLTQAIASSNMSQTELTKCAANAPHFDSNGDFVAFLDCLARQSNPSVIAAANNLKALLKSAIFTFDYSDGAGGFVPTFKAFESQPIMWADGGQEDLAQGINIYLPVMRLFNMSEFGTKSELERYKNTDFAKATGWTNVISRFVSNSQLQADATIDMKLICQWNANASSADVDFCILEPIPSSSGYSGNLSPFSKTGTIYGEFSADNLGPGGNGMEWFRFDSGPINRDFQIFAVAQSATDINVSLSKAGMGKDDGSTLFSTVTNKSRNYGYGTGIVYLGRVRWNGQGWVYSAPGRTGQWTMLTKAPTKQDIDTEKYDDAKPVDLPIPDRNHALEIAHIAQKFISIVI